MKLLCFCLLLASPLLAQPGAAPPQAAPPADFHHFQLTDVFDLEYASDPQISPDGTQVVYLRNFYDIQTDRRRANLWIAAVDGTKNRPLSSGNHMDANPRWSPDGTRLLYTSTVDGSSQLYVRWMDSGQVAKLTNLTRGVGNITWSPDGRWIALTQNLPAESTPLAKMPAKPEGAQWADPPKVIDTLNYRFDGAGYLAPTYSHIFILSAEGGTPRQLTFGNRDYGSSLSWTPDSQKLAFATNLSDDWEYQPQNSEVHLLDIASGKIQTLTDRFGPDNSPVVSPDGKHIAYLGYDDQFLGFQVNHLYIMNLDGSNKKRIDTGLDRQPSQLTWAADSKGVYVQYPDQGNTKLAHINLDGERTQLAENLGGLSIGRPYDAASFSVANNGRIAYTLTTPAHPADVAVVGPGMDGVRRLTRLNDDLFAFKKLGKVEEIRYQSSFDAQEIQGWIVKPPDFDPNKKYPLLLEIHGGPFADYGDRFSAEMQLYASAGYVVLYTNPRGSTSYGQDFGNLIHHNYPGEDYDDLISGVDAVIAKGYVDENNLFVTGGSGGGVLTSWIVGKTDRFRAAVVAKPVINWASFALTADFYQFFHKYWFGAYPWEAPEKYWERSPLSLVGNVTTPTMLLTGEEDYRTPMSETEQYYQALKLRKVDTAMVRIPGASHSIAARPSQLIAKVAYITAWFEKYRQKD